MPVRLAWSRCRAGICCGKLHAPRIPPCPALPLPRRLHKTLVKQLKYALVWGSSVKHRPQKVGACAWLPRALTGAALRARERTHQGGWDGWLASALPARMTCHAERSLPLGHLQVGKDHVLQDEDIVQLVRHWGERHRDAPALPGGGGRCQCTRRVAMARTPFSTRRRWCVSPTASQCPLPVPQVKKI